MTDRYISLDTSSGLLKEQEATPFGGDPIYAGRILALDSAGRIDSSILPFDVADNVFFAQAGETIGIGDFVYIDKFDLVRKAFAGANGNDAVGFVKVPCIAGDKVPVHLTGRNGLLNNLVVGRKYFLSTLFPGKLQDFKPTFRGARLQFIGIAISKTDLFFNAREGIALY